MPDRFSSVKETSRIERQAGRDQELAAKGGLGLTSLLSRFSAKEVTDDAGVPLRDFFFVFVHEAFAFCDLFHRHFLADIISGIQR